MLITLTMTAVILSGNAFDRCVNVLCLLAYLPRRSVTTDAWNLRERSIALHSALDSDKSLKATVIGKHRATRSKELLLHVALDRSQSWHEFPLIKPIVTISGH
jgi:hypothetical protein